MRRFASLASLALVCACSGPVPDRPSPFDLVDQRMEARVTDSRLVGGLGLVYRQGEIAYSSAWGLRDRENGLPMTEDTVLRLFSMTKPIVSVAAMTLVEEGKLSLDDPVFRFLPQLGGLEVFADGERVDSRRDMTVKDLLTHTSGLTYGFFADHPVDQLYRAAETQYAPDLASLIDRLGQLPLKHQPGERWNYGYSTDVVGRVIEVVSGRSLDAFLDERIFEPLGMQDTGFHVREGAVSRLARIYTPDEDGRLIHATAEVVSAAGRRVRDYTKRPDFLSGGGGLAGTFPDYLKFAKILLGGGGGIVSGETLEQMLQDHVPGETAFGLGFGLNDAPDGSGTLYGWGGAAGTRFWIHPESETIVLFGTQLYPGGGNLKSEARREFLEAVYDVLGAAH